MSIIQGTAKSGSTGFYDYPIGDSLRFDGTSSYLSRTPTTASNRKTWTWSGWVKRVRLGTEESLLSCGNSTTDTTFNQIIFGSDDTLRVNAYSTSWRTTSAVYRDISAWYHFVIAFDTTQATGSNRVKVYVNGEQVTAFSISNDPTQNTDYAINQATQHTIGRYDLSGGGNYFDGYLANIQFIDGQALDPYFFGESKNGVWIPYNAFSTAGSGTATASDGGTANDDYGTNGFHLTFEDGIESLSVEGYTGSVNAFRDKSGNNKHWKIN